PRPPRALPSFPTRRSSDLVTAGPRGPQAREEEPMTTLNRRTFLKGAGALGAASLAGPAISKDWAFARAPLGTPATPIEHILIDCQENRSFDHYFGYAPFAGAFGPPAGYSQPDGNGGSLEPYQFTALSTPDIGHS